MPSFASPRHMRFLGLGAVALLAFPALLFPINFNAPRFYAPGSGPGQSIATGDFNRDGVSDMAIGSTGTIQIFVGQRDGGLQPGAVCQAQYLSDSTSSLAVADFNHDGIMDISAVTNIGILVYLGNGDGTFGKPQTYARGSGLYSIAAGDFNGDGNMDLAAVNTAGNYVSVILGKGDGTFQPALAYAVGAAPKYLAVGDFNRDGKLDLAVTDYGNSPRPGNVSILYGLGNGAFQKAVNHATGLYPQSIAVGDFNGDGQPDLAIALFEGDVQILLAGTGGTFLPPLDVPAGPNPVSLQVLSNSGKLNLVVANQWEGVTGPGVGGNTVSILNGNGDGTFQSPETYFVAGGKSGYSVEAVAFGDFNGDGRVDMAAVGGNLSILPGTGPNQFQRPAMVPVGTGPMGITAGDFNGDGKPDLAVANAGSNTVSILIGKGDGTFLPQVMYNPAGRGPTLVVAGDFNRDGKLDLAVGVETGVAIMLGNGDGTFQAGYLAIRSSALSLATADFNLDGNLDLVSETYVALGNGDGTFGTPAYFPYYAENSYVTVGDFNGDGVPDVALAGYDDGGYYGGPFVDIYLGLGNGQFKAGEVLGYSAYTLRASDFNGDGKIDLTAGFWSVLGNGDGTFDALVDGTSGNVLAVGDFNNDGKLDILTSGVSIALGNGDGTFQPAVNFIAGGIAQYAAVADFNGDGKLDAAVTGSGANGVNILLNTTTNHGAAELP